LLNFDLASPFPQSGSGDAWSRAWISDLPWPEPGPPTPEERLSPLAATRLGPELSQAPARRVSAGCSALPDIPSAFPDASNKRRYCSPGCGALRLRRGRALFLSDKYFLSDKCFGMTAGRAAEGGIVITPCPGFHLRQRHLDPAFRTNGAIEWIAERIE
jgi:hypothetical protein